MACDRALNDVGLDDATRELIKQAAHHRDHNRLAALFVKCEEDNCERSQCMHAFMASRVSSPATETAADAADRDESRRLHDFYNSAL